MKTQLDFCFKGERNYVQGPDIFNKIIVFFEAYSPTNIDIKFNGIVSKNLELIDGFKIDDAKVNISLTLQGEAKNFQLIESEEEISCRYAYDESLIIGKTNLTLIKQAISLGQATEFTFCENIVAMNKKLLETIYPDENGKWYFTRLELNNPVEDNALITIKLIKNFKFRLTKSDIYIKDECVGSVYFTMVRT